MDDTYVEASGISTDFSRYVSESPVLRAEEVRLPLEALHNEEVHPMLLVGCLLLSLCKMYLHIKECNESVWIIGYMNSAGAVSSF